MFIPIPPNLPLPTTADTQPFDLKGSFIVIEGFLVPLSLNGCTVNRPEDNASEEAEEMEEEMEEMEGESPMIDDIDGICDYCGGNPCDCESESMDEVPDQADPTAGGPEWVAEKPKPADQSVGKGDSFVLAIETAMRPKRK